MNSCILIFAYVTQYTEFNIMYLSGRYFYSKVNYLKTYHVESAPNSKAKCSNPNS